MLQPNRTYTIGAGPDCDIVVGEPQVSGLHARLTWNGSLFQIEDAGSRNGLFVRGQRVAGAPVVESDVVGLGTCQRTIGQLLALIGRNHAPTRAATGPQLSIPQPGAHHAPTIGPDAQNAMDLPVTDVEVGAKTLVLGREADCAIVVIDTAVSGRHARVFRNAGRVILEDLGSRNGTFVRVGGQGDWVSYRSCVLRRQDVVRVGKRAFRFRSAPADQRPGARLDVQDLSLTVTHRATGVPLNLLNNVSFTALDGEVVGILGPSGSGKTSLLNVLAGFDAPTSGRVLVQGRTVHAGTGLAEGMGALVGHAPQFDVAHELLTVQEAVRYSAKLRGPANWSGDEVDRRVAQAIEDVGLSDKRHTPLGSEARKTLSGGQKKRVNIAMELVLDPPVLLLDEPTSGLSAHDTMELMALLRRLADANRTIVLTIHQPSYAAFVQMDQVLLLEEGGHVAWFGPAAIESFDFFGVTDREPGALLERMPKKADPATPGELAQRYQASEVRQRLVQGRAETLAASPPTPWPVPAMPGSLSRAATLVERNLRMKLRDVFFLLLTVAVPVVVSALFVAVLGSHLEGGKRNQDFANVEHQYMVFLTIMTCFFGALAASLEIVTEIPILRRERRGGLGLGSYLVSKAITYAIPAVIFPAMALLTLHVLAGDVLRGGFGVQWMVLAPTFFAAAAAGLLLSSIVGSAQGVVVVAVFYAIIQVVFSVFVPLHVTQGEQPRASWLQAVSVPMTARWALGGLASTSDLCDVGDAARRPVTPNAPIGIPTTPPSLTPDEMRHRVEDAMFLDDCKSRMYQDHGIRAADEAAQRTDQKHRINAVLANLLLAALAMAGAGIALIRRSRGTQ